MAISNLNLKHSAIVKDIKLVPEAKGYVLLATMVKDISRNKFKPGEEIRSSRLVKIDFITRIYETENTIYYEE